MAEDFLALDDNADAERQPALIVGRPCSPDELLLIEYAHRHGSRFPGACHVIFTTAENGPEEFDPGEAKRWQGIMTWPREPTLSEAMAFQQNARAALQHECWGKLQRLRAETGAGQEQPAG